MTISLELICLNFRIDMLKFCAIYVALVCISANCWLLPQGVKVKFDRTFTLEPTDSVRTEDRKLKLELKEVGREISESGEVVYVELKVQTDNAEKLIKLRFGKDAAHTVGNYIIKLISAESFGKKTYCQLQISRKD